MKPATPLPWCIDAGDNVIRGGETYIFHLAANFKNNGMAADTRYALHACNAYPRLIYALREARQQIQYLQEKFQETGSGNAVLASIDARLNELGEIK